MAYVKKLVVQGFKSFAKPTEILFEQGMNTIIGPNGSGKSNVSDAICFVLGRLSIKSIRAAKAANLIYNGGKENKPASEARVDMIFDNSDKVFFGGEEIKITRIVRRDGQSIYKIDGKTKTRQEMLDLLAQAGIDPYGFNIILQGEISRFVEMHSDDRRKIVEDIAGISIYEIRKEKSLRELEKTDEKLKEVNTVLRERTSYMKNLESERHQALKFKKLEETVKKCKASILKKKMDEKSKDGEKIEEEISKKRDSLEKIKANISKTQDEIKRLNDRVEEINSKIQKSSGVEQAALVNEISELKVEIAGLSVKKENYQNQTEGIARRKVELEKNITNSEKEIEEMKKSKGKSIKHDLENKKKTLDELEENRRKSYSLKSSLGLLNERLEDKKREIQKTEQDSEFTLKRIEEAESSLGFKDNLEKNRERLDLIKSSLEENRRKQQVNEKILLETEKEISATERQILDLENLKKQVGKMDVCPLCKTKITSEHVHNIEKEADEKIRPFNEKIGTALKKKGELWDTKESLIIEIRNSEKEIEERLNDISRLESIEERKQHLRDSDEERKMLLSSKAEIENRKKQLEKTISQLSDIEENYDTLKLEVGELSRREEKDVGMEITVKQRDLDRMNLIIKQILREKEVFEEKIKEISAELAEKEKNVKEKERKEQELQIRFKKMFEEKNALQDKVRLFETDLFKKQHDIRVVEEEVNDFKIKAAETNAQFESVMAEYGEFSNVEIIKASLEELQSKLEDAQNSLNVIGSVNLRALEVYDNLRKEYDEVAQKIAQLENEKQEILKVIEEIDKKKKNSFIKTLNSINQLFSENFSKLSGKGYAWLDIESKDDIFAGGLDIIVKIAKGKYMDISSLSGGEQVLVALSLIFAIQEYKPYCFYIFDEIDAALDKRNSERLAGLLNSYTKMAQCITITHNDAIISGSTTLYGVSMQDGVSKVISLKV